MKLRKTLAAAGALAIASGAFAMQPSTAAEDSTAVTFTVAAGGITIDAPAGPVSLAPAVLGNNAAGGSVTAALGDTTISDNRGGLAANWSSYARMDAAFTDGTNTIPVSAATINTGTGTVTALLGGAVYTSTGNVALSGTDAVTGNMVLSILGNQSVVINPTLTVAIPVNAVAGTYSGSVVQAAY